MTIQHLTLDVSRGFHLLKQNFQQVQEENKDVYTQWANGVKFESTPSRAGSNYSATDYTRDTRHNHTDTTHLPDSNMTGPTIEDSRYEIKSDNRYLALYVNNINFCL